MSEPTTTLITTAEAAQLLGMSPRTVQRLADRGELPHERRLHLGPNAPYLFDPSVVVKYGAERQARNKAS